MNLLSAFAVPKRPLNNFFSLFFPNLCVACGRNLPPINACFCYPCRQRIQPADLHTQAENEFTERLWGRLPLRAGAAMYAFVKGSPVQYALHQLKYKDNPAVGVKIGREFGRILRQSAHFRPAEIIVPVPLHPKKERLRGYNQSAAFAEGLSEGMQVPFASNALGRGIFGESQTKKNRMERFENIRDAYYVRQPEKLQGKAVLLVDDVLTTGATLEICGNLLLELPGTTLLAATIALAKI